MEMATDDFDSKRPDHPDFMTALELKKHGFSGVGRIHFQEMLKFGSLVKLQKLYERRCLKHMPMQQ
jgi:hypothetical protein